MSTYIYLVCEAHDEPVRAEDESGQHLYDLPQLRFDWLNRKHWLAYIEQFPDALTREYDHLSYFQRNTFWFLRDHAECGDAMHVVTEYGERMPLHVESIDGLLDLSRIPPAPNDQAEVKFASVREALDAVPVGTVFEERHRMVKVANGGWASEASFAESHGYYVPAQSLIPPGEQEGE